MRYAIEGAVLALWFLAAGSAGAQPVADVVNASKPTLCAESDNVNLTLASPQVKGFSIEARHPAYIGALVADRSAPDFHNCDMSGEPTYKSTARRISTASIWSWLSTSLPLGNCGSWQCFAKGASRNIALWPQYGPQSPCHHALPIV
jgi:hypothetical protein